MVFKTFRSQILWNFALTIAILSALSIGMVVSMLVFFVRSDRLVYSPSQLAKIATDMNQVHQYLANFVNYDDPRYVSTFHTAIEELHASLESFYEVAREISSSRRDMEFLYAFLEIQNQLTWYQQESGFLIERAVAGEEERFLRFDRLHDLRDLKGRIIGAISDLLFRQMTYVQRSYEQYRQAVRNQWLVVLIVYALSVAGLVHWAGRQARAISRPVRHLVEQGRKIAGHDYNIAEAPGVRNAELQTLNRTFSIMAAEIAHSIEALSQKSELERTNLEMAQSLKQAELELLQSQINPHFLFNTLNTITSLSQIEEATETERLLTSFATMLRFNLRNMHSIIPVSQELEVIEHYLFIQKQRFGARLRYYVEVDDDAREARIPSLSIQPLVENALIHGIEPVRGGGSVVVLVTREGENDFLITVCDSGRGIPRTVLDRLEGELSTVLESREHLGLANTMRRIRLYDPAARLQIDTADGCGTTVAIRVHEPRRNAS